jgi:hypothetical protein
MKIKIHGTIREEGFGGPEYGVLKFAFLANYDFSISYFQFICV